MELSVTRTFRALFLSVGLLCPLSSSAAVVYVNGNSTGSVHDGKSWATAFVTVQAGINAAASGDEVWVAASAPGATAYRENLTISRGVALYGGFAGSETARGQRDWLANVTVLDGRRADSVINVSPSVTEPFTVDGFTIRNGIAPYGSGGEGGGIRVRGGSPTIRHNVLTSNEGQGVFVESSVTAVLDYNTAVGNTGTSLYIWRATSATISNNAVTGNGGGVAVQYASAVTVANNVVTGSTGDGMSLGASGSVTVTDNYVSRNAFAGISWSGTGQGAFARNTVTDNNYTGIYLSGQGASVLTDNLIAGNGDNGFFANFGSFILANNTICGNVGNGVFVDNGATVSVYNTLITASRGTGFCVHRGTVPGFGHNNVFANAGGDYANYAPPSGQGNISADPRLSSRYHDIHLQPDSPCIDAGDDAKVTAATDLYGHPRIAGAHVDIGCDESTGKRWEIAPRTWYVRELGSLEADGLSWATAKRTIAGALASAQGGDEVWAASGLYLEQVTIPPGVALYGGFAGTETSRSQRDVVAHPTIIDANDPYRDAVTFRFLDALLDGFTVRGKSTAEMPWWTGDGVAVWGGVASLRSNTITGSNYGVRIYHGAAVVSDCSVSGNRKSGIGLDNAGAVGVIEDCKICDNAWTGVAASGTVILRSVTISGNHQQGLYLGAPSSIANTIIASNTPGNFPIGSSTYVVDFRHNDLYGDPAGDALFLSLCPPNQGSISRDPQFVDPANGDYHLKEGSFCIDSGDDVYVTAGETDLDGHPRKQGGHVDIGCYEFPTPTTYALTDVAAILKVVGGVWAGTPDSMTRLNPDRNGVVDLRDAVRLARKVAGLEPNP